MKLVNLEQKVFIPIVDENKGGATYEVQMSIAEVFKKFFEGNTPQIVDAVPVAWLLQKMQLPVGTDANPFGYVLAEWQGEQEAGR